jgi:hypothetical protein
MRKLFLIAILVIASVSASYAQNYTKSGKTYKSEKTVSQSSERETGFTWEDSKGIQYPIYMGPSGSCYIKRVSKKTGNEYKQYLGTEISADICKQLGVEYKSTK